jgi:outer membrane protein TolC
MKNKNLVHLTFAFLMLLTGLAEAADPLTLRKTVQRVIDEYPSVRLSRMQLDKARQDIVTAESQLGWQLNAKAGGGHDTGFIGSPADTQTAGVGIQRQLSSGGTLGLSGSYSYEDDAVPLAGFPNPLTRTNADISYRLPLRQGYGNPLYKQAETSAYAGFDIARAGHRGLLTSVTQQVIDLYYGVAATQARMRNTQTAVERAQRLLEFVRSNSRLGLAEKKDILQAEAQLRATQADFESLKTAWEQQRTNLNRLMGRPWDEEIIVAPVAAPEANISNIDTLIAETEANNGDLVRLGAQLKIADSSLQVAKDKYKNKLDLVMTAGTRNGSAPGFDQSDYAATVNIEFQRPLSRQGLKAQVFKAQLDQDIARREMEKTRDDIRYQVRGLVSEITTAQAALAALKERLATEQEKMQETRYRYRNGRADTSQVIQFENELSFAELAVDQQQIELARKQHSLQLLRGSFWIANQLENTGLEVNTK